MFNVIHGNQNQESHTYRIGAIPHMPLKKIVIPDMPLMSQWHVGLLVSLTMVYLGLQFFPVALEELFPQYIQTGVLIILKPEHVGYHDAIQTVNLKIAY
jgi:hypothetical protein